jgi:hypothetical protein
MARGEGCLPPVCNDQITPLRRFAQDILPAAKMAVVDRPGRVLKLSDTLPGRSWVLP